MKCYITIKRHKLLINVEIQMNLKCKVAGIEPASEICASTLGMLVHLNICSSRCLISGTEQTLYITQNILSFFKSPPQVNLYYPYIHG